jgi:amino acid adenylation domain-containing protein
VVAELGERVPVLDLAADAWRWKEQSVSNPTAMDVGLTPRDLAYVIYTSGSTGMPKGVMVEHRSVVNLLTWSQERCPLRSQDKLLQRTPISFDASVWELFWPVGVGAQLVMAPLGIDRDPARLVELVRDTGITIAQFVPAILESFVTHAKAAGSCAGLRSVFCGGGELSATLARRFREHLGSALLYNVYGPTETCVDATAWMCGAGPEGADVVTTRIPIGRPIANTYTYLLDERLRPVPQGAVGEIYIGGAGLARGYLRRPDLTAQRFIANPFVAGDRLYKSGDLGRYRADGHIEFFGRNDFQVKIRGFRIELGEIEVRLTQHPQVRDAVVVARMQADEPGEERLVAYYTPTQPDQEVDALSLRMHLSATLPQYMVPAAYVRLEALPLTPNGKLDAQALPAPSGVAYGRHGYEPPVGPVEAALAAIWVEVLGLERISRHDNFFYLGGHSLLAMRVVSRIREELHAEVSLVEVFTHPTLLQLARTVEQHSGAALPPVTPVVRSQLMAPSFAQQRPWFLAQTASGSQAYHMTQDFRLNGALDEAALRRALDRLVARHESLRTTFVPVDGAGFQCIGSPDIGFALALDDLTGLTNSKTQLERLIDTEGMAVFDLQTGPLIRGRLIRLSSREHVLLITMHHMISDGWSVGVLVRELSALYSAYRAGEPDPLPPLAVQYADYAAWQRQWLSGEVLATQCAYWRQTLAQTPVLLDLPTDRKRPPRQDYTAGCVPFELDVQLSADLNAASRRHGMTVFMILLAGWAVVLSRMSGQKDVVIGSPTANRRRVELEGLIGFFVNTLALRVDLTGDPTIEELLRRVKAAALGAQEHQDLPFEQVVELLAPVRSAAHTPLFQVMFAWQNNKKDSLQLPGLEVEPLDSGYFVAKFDLTLHAWPSGKCIVGGLEYATALFDRETAERYVGYLRMALVSIARSTGLLVAAIPLLSQQERDRLLTPHPQHTPAQHDHRCIHELFEAQVERAPGAVAVIHEDRCLTYGELNVQANRVAHALIARGIGPEDLVGLAVSRSLDMLVGLLGILKAGGAYVPLDPEYPAQRLTFMLEDAQPAVVITSVSGIGSLPVGIVDLLILDESSLELAACASHNPGVMAHRQPLTEQTPAYVIYTSGSTGMPKGVVLPHRVLHNLIAWQECTSRGLRGRVVAQLAPLSFDVSLQETLLALTTGMTLHIPDQTTRRDPVALIGWLERNAINALFAPNSLIETLCAAAMDSGASLQALNVIFQAGEPLCLSSSVRAFFSRPGRRLHNHYGPTETHVATAHELADDPSQWPALAPIGQPIANTRIYLLDERLQPVPQGAVGEIYIGGAGVARGYLRRPDLTAQRFIASPFVEGDRLYDSGDLGRYRADGHLEFLGRNDFQVKIRGFRIELGEIEARLAQHAQVREAVIAARADEPGDERLVAYYTTRQPEEGVDTLSLRTYLSAALPEYMVPAAYVRLETLPLTPNGKLDRNALPAPNGAAYGRQEHEPPVGPIETALAAIWTAVLGLETLSRHDNFFHLGGHSLLAVRVVSRIRQELNAEVPLAALFDHPTVVELAQYLPQTNSAPRTLPRPPISPDHS